MPVAPTYPGVYVEELPSGVHAITGVSTSVTAFLGYFTQGPMDQATQIFGVADLERTFGPLNAKSEAGYAIRQFFTNGGTEAWVIRVEDGSGQASFVLEDPSSNPVLTAKATSAGAWGAGVRLDVDWGTSSAELFNLTVSQVDPTTGAVLATEMYRNLTLDSNHPGYAETVVNAGSSLITLTTGTITWPNAAPYPRPVQSGTTSTQFDTTPISIDTTDDVTVDLQLTGSGPVVAGSFKLTTNSADIYQLAAEIQAGLRGLAPVSGLPGLGNATVAVLSTSDGTNNGSMLQVKAGVSDSGAILTFSGLGANDLNLTSAKVQHFSLTGGSDGSPPTTATNLLGDPNLGTGLHALDKVDIFNILSIPDVMNLHDAAAAAVIAAAEAYCESRWAFYIVDVPQADGPRTTVPAVQAWLNQNNVRHKNGALYFPRPKIPDPLSGFILRTVASSGTIAGLYATIDASRGVWKAPAGTEAVLVNVPALETKLTDAQNGTLNPHAINCLRSFPVFGNVCWGARTLEGDDQLTSEWKYVPVRRLALYIEESLYRGTKWVVFEPNDEPLWAQIRLNVGSFMNELFRQGAFQGTTPQQAYFVKCDSTTTTQNDINLGVVNIVVGFAPLIPAEFVIIQIQQIAGQTAG